MENNQYLKVGKIVNTHGIKGEIKVVRITDFDNRFDIGTTLYIKQNGTNELIKVEVDGHRQHKQFDLIHLKGFDNINDVEKYKGSLLVVDKEQLEELEDNEFYYFEIIDCDVYTTGEKYIGKVKEILSPAANDVWVVRDENNKDILIPYIEPVVKKVDITEKKIIIEPMEGLLE
ncbi:16S rRNA processing protein RimM [Gracilibacillus ureilyticus]|uniref:Ribosome maturation factor RimM n=1 Tax=Gracilibacillus ureilyticus TaxID=531814 RepID=A0A1H9L394_9BACI|nr:ribosome maturation factor RimM [Gracilibacillus ureilyticus]SER05830.1 16S rRNA processing protein RimM [Gracilibacillus ureilyticus]